MASEEGRGSKFTFTFVLDKKLSAKKQSARNLNPVQTGETSGMVVYRQVMVKEPEPDLELNITIEEDEASVLSENMNDIKVPSAFEEIDIELGRERPPRLIN